MNYEQKYNLLVAFIRGLEVNMSESNQSEEFAKGALYALSHVTDHIKTIENRIDGE